MKTATINKVISVQESHKIAQLLPSVTNAATWQSAKRECPALPELKTCYRWKNNDVAKFLSNVNEPVSVNSTSDLWSRTYTVTLKAGSQEMFYTY